jgi:O-succinylbenzoic acid--CoA ligase
MERAELSRALRSWLSQVPSPKAQVSRTVSEADPLRFMSSLAAAAAGEGDVFLCDPQWGERERAQFAELLARQPEARPVHAAAHRPGDYGWLMIPTGGSSGRLKFARHDGHTLGAAVRGFQQHFGLQRVNAAGLLPLHHVSGLMAWLRCVLTGGEYRPLEWKAVESGDLPELPDKPDGWVVSVVPTQLERLMRRDEAVIWLRQFRIIFLGGAPASSGLLDRAAALGLRLAPGYGMTETAAMVTALQPGEFLAGKRGGGTALPHAQVALTAQGLIRVGGRSLFRGYFPAWREAGDFVTADRGQIDAAGHLTVLGRADDIIITGGEKVSAAEIETFLRDHGGLEDAVVVGVLDAEWGQQVVAAYPARLRPDIAKVQQLINSQLAPHKRPKRVVALADWPVTGAGKVNRAEVARRLAQG